MNSDRDTQPPPGAEAKMVELMAALANVGDAISVLSADIRQLNATLLGRVDERIRDLSARVSDLEDAAQ